MQEKQEENRDARNQLASLRPFSRQWRNAGKGDGASQHQYKAVGDKALQQCLGPDDRDYGLRLIAYGILGLAAGVPEKRGAGAGCTTSSTVI